MYRTGSASTMGSLRKDYVARIPIDLDCSSVSSAVPITASTQLGTARILIKNSGVPSGVSVVRCRVDSDNSPSASLTENGRQPSPYLLSKQPEVTLGFDTASKWSSDSRETGSILKKPEFSSQTLTSDRSKRTPQGRRKVRFTNNVAMYRFDSDGVDSAHSSSECERFSAPPFERKTVPSNRQTTTAVVFPGNASSTKFRVIPADDYDVGGGGGQRFMGSRRVYEEKMAAYPFDGHQQVRSPKVFHGTPSGSLYLRNNFERATSLPSVQWLGSSSSSSSSSLSSLQKSGAYLRSTSYALLSDSVTHDKKLVISAKLSDAFHPNDITIKANKSGSKIRIVSNKSPSSSSSSSSSLLHSPVIQVARHQINEQIILPVHVDPYRLTARLDANGSLLIEAPCLV